ncbi:GGDEF domain-containing protein [Halomonas sp. ND22Bw]|uniref:GGDEF domain-containing protein n=1 Tax=Halomonas sp. ND22Bw TaxID=2054178 RepID=UPI0026992BE6
MPLTLTRSDGVPRLVRDAPIGICITSEDGTYEMVNPAYCAFYGYAEEELLGRPFTLIMPEASQAAMLARHRDFMQGEAEHDDRQEWEVVRRDGERRSIIVESLRQEGDDGRPRRITFITDITERKAMEQRLEFLARHDELTGLLNRRAGLARLEEEISRARRHGTSLCVAICDLDHFKLVNDRHGHAVGDRVLQGATERMEEALRGYDVLARLGGEEFLVILPGARQTEARCAIDRLRERLAATPLGEERIPLTISVGLASLEANEASHLLLERADRALYRAKRDGRNRTLVG